MKEKRVGIEEVIERPGKVKDISKFKYGGGVMKNSSYNKVKEVVNNFSSKEKKRFLDKFDIEEISEIKEFSEKNMKSVTDYLDIKENSSSAEEIYEAIVEKFENLRYKESKVFLDKYGIEEIEEFKKSDIDELNEVMKYFEESNSKEVKMEGKSEETSHKAKSISEERKNGFRHEEPNREEEGDSEGNEEEKRSKDLSPEDIEKRIEDSRKKNPEYLNYNYFNSLVKPGDYDYEVIDVVEKLIYDKYKKKEVLKIKIIFKIVNDEKFNGRIVTQLYNKILSPDSNLFYAYTRIMRKMPKEGMIDFSEMISKTGTMKVNSEEGSKYPILEDLYEQR